MYTMPIGWRAFVFWGVEIGFSFFFFLGPGPFFPGGPGSSVLLLLRYHVPP